MIKKKISENLELIVYITLLLGFVSVKAETPLTERTSLISTHLYAETPLSFDKSFSVGVSYGVGQYKEELINNLANKGINTSLELNYALNRKQIHDFGLKYDLGFLHNRYDMASSLMRFQFKYQLNFKVDMNRLLFGLFVNYSSLFYNNGYYDAQHNYWFTHADLGFGFKKRFVINHNLSLSVPVSFPILGFVSRPAANRQFSLNEPDLQYWDVAKRINSNYKFYWVGNDCNFLQTGINLHYRLKNRNIVTVGYQLYYEGSNKEKHCQYLTNNLSINYSFL
jgi:hypothetical protein